MRQYFDRSFGKSFLKLKESYRYIAENQFQSLYRPTFFVFDYSYFRLFYEGSSFITKSWFMSGHWKYSWINS